MSATNPTNGEKIVLGSGKVYITEFVSDSIPENGTIETDANLLGLIQGGASLEYTQENYTAEDDLGLAKKVILTKETAVLKSGIMTWCGKTLQKLCSTARVSEDASKKTRTVKIGGVSNQDGKQYLIRFVHTDSAEGTIRITITGKNQAGFTLAFAKDKETVINAEFTALPIDDEGTLIIYEEEIAGAA